MAKSTLDRVKLTGHKGISLIVAKGKSVYDMSSLVQSIKWGGAKSAMPRTCQINMLDSDRYGHARPKININEGQQCMFLWNGKELFRGIFMNVGQSSTRQGTYKAYDLGIYLAKNMDTFVYKKKTATQIFDDICKEFEIPHSSVDTGYVIKDLTKPNTTAADAIWAALAKTYNAKKKRYYVLAQKGELKLIARADNMVQLVLEEGANAISYTRERSIENVYTRVKLYSDENKGLASAKDTGIESKIGIMQYTEQADSKDDKSALEAKAKTLLSIKKQTEETLEIECIGDPSVYSGIAVYLHLPYLGVKKTYYVDEDEHVFTGTKHTMRLKLNRVNDVEGANDDENKEV